MMQLSQIANAVNGELLGADVSLNNISINTRELCEGRLFVALKGENFDAHNFIGQAEQAGAAAVMVERSIDTALPSVRVSSTHQALKTLAAWWRAQFELPLVGVTGSVGKTTVKEMLACIFAEIGPGVVTKGNLNNEIGVPLTLMNLSAEHQFAIVEMGMNRAGEIARLSNMSRPTIALINNAAAAHLEGLGSIEAVAAAKGEIFQGLSADGVAIINRDDQFADFWVDLAKGHSMLTFGLSQCADVTAGYTEDQQGLQMMVNAAGKTLEVNLQAAGKHNVLNALAAITVALAAKIPLNLIEKGLAKFRPVSGRLNFETVSGVELIDDTYNANPASMRAAISVLVTRREHLLVIGDMAELGDSAEAEHRELGRWASSQGVKRCYVCGNYAHLVAQGFGEKAVAFDSQEELIEQLSRDEHEGTILVKGSRSARMEKVIAALRVQLNNKKNKEPQSSSLFGGEH